MSYGIFNENAVKMLTNLWPQNWSLVITRIKMTKKVDAVWLMLYPCTHNADSLHVQEKKTNYDELIS